MIGCRADSAAANQVKDHTLLDGQALRLVHGEGEANDDGELSASEPRALLEGDDWQYWHPLRLLRVEGRARVLGHSTTRASGMLPMPPGPHTAPTKVPRVPLASPYR